MTLDFGRCRLPPFTHQREDVQALIEHPYFFITSEMRTGKSKIVIDAAQFLYTAKMIDKVLIVAPAPVRDVWYDKELGEIRKHGWLELPAIVQEFHSKVRAWSYAKGAMLPTGRANGLHWLVTNYEFIRSKNRLTQLLPFCDQRTLLVLDESSFVKTWDAAQTKACGQLRKECGRVTLLNGTPIFHSPLDLFSQGNLLHPSILQCKYITHYKARYAIQETVRGPGGKPLQSRWGGPVQKIVGWTNLDDLQRRFAPYTVRRLQKECPDMPVKLDSVPMTATLTTETWRAYKEMRDELVIWFNTAAVSSASTAAIKALRLSQITSGFVGGVEAADIGEDAAPPPTSVSAIGREKLDVLLWMLGQHLIADPNLHVVVWCRFRPELFRMLSAVREAYPQFVVGSIQGSQHRDERLRALALLKPETSPRGPVFVGGIEGTGSYGLDFTAAHTCITMSSGYSPGKLAQTLDRVYGPGQTHPIAYFSILATGPQGQRTIDHEIEKARRNGENVANWTADAWVRALTRE